MRTIYRDSQKLECLNKFLIFGKRHLDHVNSLFVDYYPHHRSHMERDDLPPVRGNEPEAVETLKLNEVMVKSHVGGLVRSFERKAA
jgi:hypothetical protein